MPYIPDQQPPESIVLSSFKGLRNNVSPERLAQDELEAAVNIDLDDVGQIHRRRGYYKKVSGRFHSLFKTGYGVLAARDGGLVLVYDSFEVVDLGYQVGNSPISYTSVGINTYFSSQEASGVVKHDLTVEQWGEEDGHGEWLSPVVLPTSTLGAVGGKLIGAPPLATDLTYYRGRIYLARDQYVWATELYLYNYVNKTRGVIPMTARVTGIGAVTDGIYVGTEDGLYFLSGASFDELMLVPLAPTPVIRGSLIAVNADQVRLNFPQATKNAVMFMTTMGVCVGIDGGTVINLTQDRFVFPVAQSAATMFRRQEGMNQFVASIDSGGTPSASARIGDYAEAEIRRFRS